MSDDAKVTTVETLEALKALAANNGDRVFVQGAEAPGDGGGGYYHLDSSTAADNSGGWRPLSMTFRQADTGTMIYAEPVAEVRSSESSIYEDYPGLRAAAVACLADGGPRIVSDLSVEVEMLGERDDYDEDDWERRHGGPP